MEKELPSPLVLPAIFWGFGILSGKLVNFYILIVMFIAFSIFLIYKRFRKITILILIFILGGLRVGIPKSEISISNILKNKDEITQKIILEIDSFPIIKNHSLKYKAKILEIAGCKAEGKIYLETDNQFLKNGDFIQAIFRVKNLKKYCKKPSQIKYLQNQDIEAIAENITPIVLISHKNNYFKNWVQKLKETLKYRIKERFGKNSEFVKAIITGDKGRIRFWKKILQNSGMSHLLAVSGLHVGMISFIFYIFFKIIFPNRNYARIASIILLIFYAAICNWSASVTRASIMIIVFYISKILERPINKNQIIAIAFLIITIINPKEIFSVGFQMSFTAVIVLINFIPFKFKSHENKILNILINFLEIIQTSAILTLFLSPITIYNFGQFNLNGIIANIFGIPFFGIILSTALLILALPNFQFILNVYQSAFYSLMFFFKMVVIKLSSMPFKYEVMNYRKPIFMMGLFLLFGIAILLKKQKNPPKRVFENNSN